MKGLGDQTKMNILVTGGSGQIGSDIKLKNYNGFFFPSSSELDIKKKISIRNFIEGNNIDLILNFAAYTKVDKAEINKKIAKDINYQGALNLAKEASLREIGIIHFSTDYVFGKDGLGINLPNDKKTPVNYYGLTKSLGESAVLDNCNLGFIVRLASVYGQFGNNFIMSVMKSILKNDTVRIVYDQKISMTSSLDLSDNMLHLIDLYREKVSSKPLKNRILHFANKGYTSWFSVAKVIKDEMQLILNKKITTKLVPINSTDWNSLALRPIDSRLKVNFKELEKNNIFLPKWDKSVRGFVRVMLPAILDEIK